MCAENRKSDRKMGPETAEMGKDMEANFSYRQDETMRTRKTHKCGTKRYMRKTPVCRRVSSGGVRDPWKGREINCRVSAACRGGGEPGAGLAGGCRAENRYRETDGQSQILLPVRLTSRFP